MKKLTSFVTSNTPSGKKSITEIMKESFPEYKRKRKMESHEIPFHYEKKVKGAESGCFQIAFSEVSLNYPILKVNNLMATIGLWPNDVSSSKLAIKELKKFQKVFPFGDVVLFENTVHCGMNGTDMEAYNQLVTSFSGHSYTTYMVESLDCKRILEDYIKDEENGEESF